MNMQDNTMIELDIKDDVRAALAEGRPVVALESSIISHGLPYPENMETALLLEETVRKEGAIPSTIAIIGGRIKIGLEEGDLQLLAAPDSGIAKISRRDLPSVIRCAGHGATTVAATMMLAERAGISVFATGGVGGVHRGAETSFDISADLEELTRTSVCVVCAGPKAILDLPLTLEFLETKSVPVIGYQTNEMPAFWSRQSGCHLYERCDTPGEIAHFLAIKRQCELDGGILVMNPIPEVDEISYDEIRQYTDEAIKRCVHDGISGKEVTPYLLDYIAKITEGRSLKANIALVVNNARLATKIAAACLSP
jgi:pseudouridine-5'-phosphate glycosidase